MKHLKPNEAKKLPKYKLVNLRSEYPNLKLGDIYHGEVLKGIFIDRPFLTVYNLNGDYLNVAHLSRFEEVDNV